MGDRDHGPGTNAGAGLERLVFFSDAVFAIAITLLILEIKVPEREAVHSTVQLLGALNELIPKFFAFLLSFIVIGFYWFMHHKMFGYIRRVDDRLVVINLTMLLFVVFLPFPVALFGSFRRLPLAMAMYAGSLAVVGVLQSLLWSHATRGRKLVDPDLERSTIRLIHFRSLAMPVVFAVSVPFSFVNPRLAPLSWLLIAPLMRLTRRRLERQQGKAASRTAELRPTTSQRADSPATPSRPTGREPAPRESAPRGSAPAESVPPEQAP